MPAAVICASRGVQPAGHVCADAPFVMVITQANNKLPGTIDAGSAGVIVVVCGYTYPAAPLFTYAAATVVASYAVVIVRCQAVMVVVAAAVSPVFAISICAPDAAINPSSRINSPVASMPPASATLPYSR